MADNPVCSVQGVCVGCAMDSDCNGRAATPVCFGEPAGACVACDENDHQSLAVGTAADHCPTAPNNVCDGATHTCRPCEADSECTSGVCDMVSGACAATVLHVDRNPGRSGADANDCLTAAAPCLTIAGAMSKPGIVGTRYIAVHASGGDYIEPGATVIPPGKKVYLVGIPDPGNPLFTSGMDRNDGNGAIVSLTGVGTELTLVRMTLRGAAGNGDGDGLLCSSEAKVTALDSVFETNAHFGIKSALCDITIDRCTIRGNAKGGASIDGDFSLTNSFVVDNVGTMFGGLDLIGFDSNDVFAHNTIALNRADATRPGSVRCDGNGTGERNILFGSVVTAVETNTDMCTHQHSLIGTTVFTGVGNVAAADVAAMHFVGSGDYHIEAGSAALGMGGAGDATGRLATDVDKQPRPTTGADIGADELP